MCGIAGIIGRLDDKNRAALERMNDAMFHRGPDASGTWASSPNERGAGGRFEADRVVSMRRPCWPVQPQGRRTIIPADAGWAVRYESSDDG
jgi:asparagine synthase (glutamine-hydrolysing)